MALRSGLHFHPDEAIPAITDLVRRLHASAVGASRSVRRRTPSTADSLKATRNFISSTRSSTAWWWVEIPGTSWSRRPKSSPRPRDTVGSRFFSTIPGLPKSTISWSTARGAPTRAEVRLIAESAYTSTATVVMDPAFGEIGLAAVRGGDRNLGTLVAGGRAGEPISSIELTLLASAAGHLGVFLRNAALYSDLDAMFLGTLQSMVAAIDAKDPYTRGHSQRVAILSRDLAAAIGLPEAFVKTAHLSGLVHDIGKIGVPEAVLCKAGRLDEVRIRRHPPASADRLPDPAGTFPRSVICSRGFCAITKRGTALDIPRASPARRFRCWPASSRSATASMR